ncbi:DUF1349 domain-containing protein [Mesorhizobium sp. BR1-1-16]|uniref:DUF1349 domain-containing protein n=1 Tax=Mesorhizobium sp. BR1-1-16 TaxID=2876653 RepID=UPI001CCF9EAB|nr:DUF1349 domain-containing protein [Mesorhizobium sp. BR1-1-16]
MQDADAYRWLNPPQYCEFRDGDLFVRTADRTDFWRGTFYGFWHDNGHFFHRSVEGDFTAKVTIDGRYDTLYDQAGLMVRLSETHWIKAGIEFTDGALHFSVVVTNDQSDWSMLKIVPPTHGLRLRMTRHGEAIRVQYLDAEDGHWKMARLAYLPRSSSIDVGMMCCSPQRPGFEVTFHDFKLGPAIARDLHE